MRISPPINIGGEVDITTQYDKMVLPTKKEENKMDVNFKVRTQANAYSVGYKEGMKDIENVIRNGGDIDDIIEWINNNR